ncbi:MAG: ATP-binding cassette domain-containing protein [Solirubrobacterales bacterium]|nr:ATP-binding cassette domain-containing protein [Solirubrobacterales bacterium]
MIEVNNLQKTFGKGDEAVHAVRGVDFQVDEGQIFGLLGANGAGKSTCVLMLATLLAPTGGSARVNGFDVLEQPNEVRQSFGAALQETGLDPLQKGVELLELHGRLYGYDKATAKARAADLLETVGLSSDGGRRIGTYSGGMRRRLDLAAALIHHPRILFLDEPTTGLDPASRRAIWEEVSKLKSEGVTVLLTTQYLEEADQLADHVAIMADGVIAATGTPDDLKAGMGADVVDVDLADEAEAIRAAAAVGSEAKVVGNEIRISATDGPAVLARVMNQLREAGIEPKGVSLTQPTLDDVFLNLTDGGSDHE